MSNTHDTQESCLLTLSFPKKLQPDITDHLRQMTDRIGGFTIIKADGFGRDQHFLTALEKVKGSTDRCLLLAVIQRSDATSILDSLKAQYERVDMYYWITPVISQGYF